MSSLMAQRIIFSTHTHSGAELIVLSALAWHADDNGVVSTISVPALALLSRLSEKQTSRVLKKLTCSGAISVEAGRGRGHHTVYELNRQIFNRTKRSVEYKGGVAEVFNEAAPYASLAAAGERPIPDGDGDLFIANFEGNPGGSLFSPSRLDGSGRPILKNSLRRRIARAREAEIKWHVERDISAFSERFPPEVPVLKPIQVHPTAPLGFTLEQALKLIVTASPEKHSPITIERPFLEAVQLILGRHEGDAGLAATWLMGRALKYYELTATWDAEEQQYVKTPAKFFEDRVYDEDRRLWDRSATRAKGGKAARNTGAKRNSSSGRTERDLDAVQPSFSR